MQTLSQRLAAAATSPVVTAPAQVIDRTRLLMYDYRAVVLRGSETASSNAARAAFAASQGRSRIEGTSSTAALRDAALLNATAAHSIELDDTHEPGSLHPGVVVWPTVFAVAEEIGSSPEEVLDAAIVGYGVVCHIARVLGGAAAYSRGFHPTGVCGVFGAAAAAGRLLRLRPPQMTNAFGIAATGASGSMEYLSDGAWTKRLNPGLAASNGILAAQLAFSGFTGPATAFEGTLGFLHAYGGSTERAHLPIDITAGVRETSVKLYPCCRYMHGCMDLLIDLAKDCRITKDDVSRIECGVLSAGEGLIATPAESKRNVRTMVDAQFSMPFGAALALTTRAPGLDDFELAAQRTEDLRDVIAIVDCYTSSELDTTYPEHWPAQVRVTLRNGKVIKRTASDMRGSPAMPVTWDDVRRKAEALIGVGAAEALLDDSRRMIRGG